MVTVSLRRKQKRGFYKSDGIDPLLRYVEMPPYSARGTKAVLLSGCYREFCKSLKEKRKGMDFNRKWLRSFQS